jgi:hypothetical protein
MYITVYIYISHVPIATFVSLVLEWNLLLLLLPRLATCVEPSETPIPLLRPMTADEVAAKTKSSRAAPETRKRMGVAAALDFRDKSLELQGVETEAALKRRKKEEAKGEKGAVLKTVRGAHLLK